VTGPRFYHVRDLKWGIRKCPRAALTAGGVTETYIPTQEVPMNTDASASDERAHK